MIAYAITDPSILNFHTLDQDLERFTTKANMIVYRDKVCRDYVDQAERFIKRAKAYPFHKVLLHSDFSLAHALQADGVHLTSHQFDHIAEAKKLGLLVIISTHEEKEIALAQKLGADMVTFSPIFDTPNKGKPKGVEALKVMADKFTIPIIALGGIVTDEQIKQCEENGAKGFASIRYFGRDI